MSLKRHIELEAEYSKYIITPLCWLNFIGHPAYWLIWTYLHPQPYDSLMLRCSATIFSLAILLRSYWPQRAKKYFPSFFVYFHRTEKSIQFCVVALSYGNDLSSNTLYRSNKHNAVFCTYWNNRRDCCIHY